MASHSQPRIVSMNATAAIAAYVAVKAGATDDLFVIGAANTDNCFGIVQTAATAAGDICEVALPGGGAKAKAGESSIAVGDLLVSHTDGTLVKSNAGGDRVIAMAMQAASSGDIFAVEVMVSQAQAAE